MRGVMVGGGLMVAIAFIHFPSDNQTLISLRATLTRSNPHSQSMYFMKVESL